jgi:hypothetical protein
MVKDEKVEELRVKYNVDPPPPKATRNRGRWKYLYDIVDKMEVKEWAEVKIDPQTTDAHFRIAVCNVGKSLRYRLSVHKVKLGTYKVGKFEKE